MSFLYDLKKKLLFYRDIYMHYWKFGRHYKMLATNIGDSSSIPKHIHYCWFGPNEMDEKSKLCIQSWKDKLPDYDLILWNESNFPFERYPFAAQALQDGKWAFVADVARLHALYYYGGIYMDTDMEVLKSLDVFLKHGFFSGFESVKHVSAGIMGAQPGNGYAKLLLDWYIDKHYGKMYYDIAITRIITKITRVCCGLVRTGKKVEFSDCCIYSPEVFYPRRSDDKWEVCETTYTIHHFVASWK